TEHVAVVMSPSQKFHDSSPSSRRPLDPEEGAGPSSAPSSSVAPPSASPSSSATSAAPPVSAGAVAASVSSPQAPASTSSDRSRADRDRGADLMARGSQPRFQWPV